MTNASRSPNTALTIGSLVAGNRGINLLCRCGHRTSLLPAQVSVLTHPSTRALDFKRRFRCSMCGRSGASGDIRLTTFEVVVPFIDDNAARPETAVPKVADN